MRIITLHLESGDVFKIRFDKYFGKVFLEPVQTLFSSTLDHSSVSDGAGKQQYFVDERFSFQDLGAQRRIIFKRVPVHDNQNPYTTMAAKSAAIQISS